MLGDWFDTVDRQSSGTEMFGHWLNAVDLQSGDTEAFGYWSDAVDRLRRSTQTFGYWLDTVDSQRGILRRLVSGWTQEIASEWNFYDVWSLVSRPLCREGLLITST